MRFVVLGDLHYSFYADPALSQGRELFYDNLLTEIDELRPDLVFSIGDAVNEGRVQEYEGLLNIVKRRGLQDRFLVVLGNHDVYRTRKDTARLYLHPPARLFPNYELPETTYYTFDFGPARFVVLDSTQEMSMNDWGGRMDATQLDWLETQIARFNQDASPQLLIALAHHPLKDTTEGSSKVMLNYHNSDEVWARMAGLERGQGLYINGHNHTDSLAERGRWIFLQAGAPYTCGDYRVCDVTEMTDGKIQLDIETVDVAGGAKSVLNLMQSLGAGLEHWGKHDNAKGLPADRALVRQLI